MPFRHVAMFRWAPHVGTGHVARVGDAFEELAAATPGIRHHAHGHDAGVSDGAFDYIVVADFRTVTEWRAYRDHPLHVLLDAELLAGHVVERVSGQYHVPDGGADADVSEPTTVGAIAPEAGGTGAPFGESDDELLARARRTAAARMEALLAESDELP